MTQAGVYPSLTMPAQDRPVFQRDGPMTRLQTAWYLVLVATLAATPVLMFFGQL